MFDYEPETIFNRPIMLFYPLKTLIPYLFEYAHKLSFCDRLAVFDAGILIARMRM